MGSSKRILIYNSGPLYPVAGMNQVRVINQIKALSKEHQVYFYFLSGRGSSSEHTVRELMNYCFSIREITTFTRSVFYKIIRHLFLGLLFEHIAYPEEWFSLSNRIVSKKIARLINKDQFDIIISHYWQASRFFIYLENRVIRAVDTHYLVEENIELFKGGHYAHLKNTKLGKLLEKEHNLQKKVFYESDLLIVNSANQKKILDSDYSQIEALCIPNGQELECFLNGSSQDSRHESNFLFYGALSNQFNEKALKRLIEAVFPLIKRRLPGANLTIMGSNPPAWLIDKTSGDKSIRITGYIKDVRTVFCSCSACIIPLESGSGFRGRVVELLAGGVPVIGTDNALKSIQIEHGVNGYISDSDEEIAKYSVLMATDAEEREKIVRNGKEFVKDNYSIEATFGKLSEYLYSI